jgi:hypothetical protein
MKALSVKQPWAELIASGRKRWEMRTWSTRYRGPLLIVAGARVADSPDALRHSARGPVASAIVLVELVDVRPVKQAWYSQNARCNVGPGDFAWVLQRPRRVPPVPVKGRLGLFDVPEAWLHALAAHPETSCEILRVVLESTLARRAL